MQADFLARHTTYRKRAAVPIAACVLAALFTAAADAQPRPVLDRILFEARLLEDSASVSLPGAAQGPVSAPGDGRGALDYADSDGASIEAYEQSIATTELAGGPFAPDLLEQFLALGELHQQQGDHEAALAAFDKADYISRINNGLYSPSQFAIVENMIESHLANGELQEAGNKQRYLLMLHEQQYGTNSLEVVPALARVGDWNFEQFYRQLALPNVVFSFSSGPTSGFGNRGQSPRAMAFGSLFQSQLSYWRAISIILNNGEYSDPRLRDLENKLIETSFLASNRDGMMRNPDFYLAQRSAYTGTRIQRSVRPNSQYFFAGRSAYERLMAYHLLTPGTDAVAMAQTLIALGDWNLLFDRQSSALRTYRQAHDFLVANKVPRTVIDALFSPTMPQQLPAMTPLPHSRAKFGIAPDATVAWDGYVDVSFRISRFGHAGHFEVLGSSGELTRDLKERLRRLVRGSPFRPRFVDGDLAREDTVKLRYYFAQL